MLGTHRRLQDFGCRCDRRRRRRVTGGQYDVHRVQKELVWKLDRIVHEFGQQCFTDAQALRERIVAPENFRGDFQQ